MLVPGLNACHCYGRKIHFDNEHCLWNWSTNIYFNIYYMQILMIEKNQACRNLMSPSANIIQCACGLAWHEGTS